jgi:hypothetical protein
MSYENPTTLIEYASTGGHIAMEPKLKYLASIAENEKWKNSDGETGILKNYIEMTFAKLLYDEKHKIVSSKDGLKTIANTGLLTTEGSDIFYLFNKNTIEGRQKWFFSTFIVESDREAYEFDELPKPAEYLSNQDYYFDATKNVRINRKHIFSERDVRMPPFINDIKSIAGEEGVRSFIEGQLAITRKRIMRNQRLAVPMYYFREKRVTYLIPLRSQNNIIPLAVSKETNGEYRVNTILSKEMAYSNARLIMKPETSWLKLI